MLTFVQETVNQFRLGNCDARVGLVQFSPDRQYLDIPLNRYVELDELSNDIGDTYYQWGPTSYRHSLTEAFSGSQVLAMLFHSPPV